MARIHSANQARWRAYASAAAKAGGPDYLRLFMEARLVSEKV